MTHNVTSFKMLYLISSYAKMSSFYCYLQFTGKEAGHKQVKYLEDTTLPRDQILIGIQTV